MSIARSQSHTETKSLSIDWRMVDDVTTYG